MRRLPSASSLDRAHACPASAALPGVERHGYYASRGTAIHQYLADVPVIGAEKALEKVPPAFRRDCEVIDLNALPSSRPESYTPEVAFAYDVDTDTVRVLGSRLTREAVIAHVGPREFFGTVDVVGVSEEAAIVPDFKTGHAFFVPKEMRQLLFYAMAAAAAYNRQRAVSGVILINEEGDTYWKRADFDAFDLANFREELRELAARIDATRDQVARGEVPQTVEGDHCRHCPALPFCPSKMALVRQMATAPESFEAMLAGATPEQLAAAWERVGLAEAVLKRVKETIKERARLEPIPMTKGQVLGPVPTLKSIDLIAGTTVLLERYGPDVAAAAQKMVVTMSKDSIEQAIRDAQGSKGIGKAVEETMAALDAVGATEYDDQIRKHKPKQLADGTRKRPAK